MLVISKRDRTNTMPPCEPHSGGRRRHFLCEAAPPSCEVLGTSEIMAARRPTDSLHAGARAGPTPGGTPIRQTSLNSLSFRTRAPTYPQADPRDNVTWDILRRSIGRAPRSAWHNDQSAPRRFAPPARRTRARRPAPADPPFLGPRPGAYFPPAPPHAHLHRCTELPGMSANRPALLRDPNSATQLPRWLSEP